MLSLARSFALSLPAAAPHLTRLFGEARRPTTRDVEEATKGTLAEDAAVSQEQGDKNQSAAKGEPTSGWCALPAPKKSLRCNCRDG